MKNVNFDNEKLLKSMQEIARKWDWHNMPMNACLQLRPNGELIIQSSFDWDPSENTLLIAEGSEIESTLEDLGMDFFDGYEEAKYTGSVIETICTLKSWLA